MKTACSIQDKDQTDPASTSDEVNAVLHSHHSSVLCSSLQNQ